MFTKLYWQAAAQAVVTTLVLIAGIPALAQKADPQTLLYRVQEANDQIEITTNSSRILTLDQKIPRASVNNPELLELTPLSATQIQIHAKKAGITQVNLWDEKWKVYSVDVVVKGDSRELDSLLRTQFPTASVKIVPTANNTAVLYGFVDRPDHVSRIVQMAEDYYPKVINNIVVGGSQQVLLHVKVMQVSRTKLRELGIDWAAFSGEKYGASTVGQIIRTPANATLLRASGPPGTSASGAAPPTPSPFITGAAETLQFGILDNLNGFVAMIHALEQYQLLKVLAEPTLVTVSGRPAQFLSGGQVAYPQATGFGNISVAFRDFGVKVDFVPIVLGNGNIRLEVRPEVSEVDNTLGTTANGTTVPGFRTRRVDTGLEMKVGQVMAIGGLIQYTTETQKDSIPILGDLPLIGAMFRRMHDKVNEIELLILVQPEVVDGLDPCDVPPGGPGLFSTSPNNCDLYCRGYMEVPTGVPAPSGQGGAWPVPMGGDPGMSPDSMQPGEPVPPGTSIQPRPSPSSNERLPSPDKHSSATWPQRTSQQASDPPRMAAANPERGTMRQAAALGSPSDRMTNRSQPQKQQSSNRSSADSSAPGLIGPTGYDVRN